MKTTKSILLILALAAAVSCVKEENPQQENEAIEFGQFSFTAVRENVGDITPSSKSQLDPDDTDDTDGRMVHWKSGDAVIVFEASDENNIVTGSNLPTDEGNWYKGYKFATEGSGLSADFRITTDDNKAASEESFNPAAGKYIMLYTYSETYYCNVEKSVARFYISPNQTATKNSFDRLRGSAIAKASSLEENVSFKNLVSLLKFTVPEEFSGKVASITVSGNGTEHIAGDVFVDFSSEEPALQAWHAKYENTNPRYSVTLKDADGMEQGDYYIAVLPTTVSEVNVTVTMTDGQTYTRSKVGEYEFKRNTIHYMGAISDAYAHLTATACEMTSSTASFTWTCGESVADDIARNYKLYLYDSADNKVVIHTINANNAEDDITYRGDVWKNIQPKFAFTGLNPNTDYYFVVEDTATQMKSNKVAGKTSDFQFVTVPEAEVGVGDVILAEDFGGLNGPETVSQAAGATKYSSLAALTGELVETNTLDGSTADNMVQYYDWSSDAKGGIIYNGINQDWLDDSRLQDWGCYKNTAFAVYAHGGHLKIGTSSNTASLVTPRLTAIPQGKSATLEVEVTMARHSDHTDPLTMAVSSINADFDNKKAIANTVNFKKTSETIELANKNVWQKYTFTINDVDANDRLVIGPSEYKNGKSIYFVSDVVVTVTDLK